MSIKSYFDPFGMLLVVFEELYPEHDCEVHWAEGLKEQEDVWGETNFDGEIPVVTVDVSCPVQGAVEIMAHELAHVVAGYDEEHGEKWQEVFRKIHEKYQKRILGE